MSTPVAQALMGWYPTQRDDARWWDGRVWTSMRVRAGKPGIDNFSSEKPGATLGIGIAYLVLVLFLIAVVVFVGALVGSRPAVSTLITFAVLSLLFLVNASLFISAAIASFAVRRLAPPTSAPLTPDVVRPLPGEVEAEGAAWYTVSPRVRRWWTGARWAQYTDSPIGLRPTFQGPRSYRLYRAVAWGILGFGVVMAIVGIVIAAWSTAISVPGWIGVALIISGIVIGLLSLILFVMSGSLRRTLLLPVAPPGAPTASDGTHASTDTKIP